MVRDRSQSIYTNGKSEFFSPKVQPWEKAWSVPPTARDAQRSTRAEGEEHKRVTCPAVLPHRPRSPQEGRYGWCSDQPAKSTQGESVTERRWTYHPKIKMHFWKSTILTSSAKFWFTSCIKLSSPALGEGRQKENVLKINIKDLE